MNASPSDIEFMIHCYCQGFEPHERFDAPTIQETIPRFIIVGLIKPYIVMKNGEEVAKENCYEATEKGAAWIKMLCNTPWPIQEWVDGRDGSVVG